MSTNFADQRDPRVVAPGSNMTSGAATTGVAEDVSPFRETPERRAIPFGGTETPQPVPVPQLREGMAQSSLTDVLGADPKDIQINSEEGFGPRLVILHQFVTGPAVPVGGGRTAFQRGRVIWASQLLGDELTQKAIDGDPEALRLLRRYVAGPNPAAREANKTEEKYTQVTFVEGEAAMTDALQNTQKALAQKEDENTRMRRIITAMGQDPNADPGEIERQLSEARAAEVVPPGEKGSGVPPPPPPPAAPTAGGSVPPVNTGGTVVTPQGGSETGNIGDIDPRLT